MLLRIARSLALLLLGLSFLMPANAYASMHQIRSNHANQVKQGTQPQLADFPTVDPNYIYDQLFTVATRFQHREAGYDNNLPVNQNGHDEFATYWSQEMQQNLQGFGPQVYIDKFPVQGWQNRPTTVPAFNVEVSIPGAVHPEQIVVIGCHYDGEAISTQSANDDASGCAIELGVAKAMGNYWRSHHTYPARTLRFVIFDAEEQGLFGSFHYLNSTINGDVKNIVAMFNEEQNGIAYPLRYLGNMSNSLLPFYDELSPLQNNGLYRHQDKLSPQQRENITRFHALMQLAVAPVFAQFQALGYQTLAYHGENNSDSKQPVFTPDQLSNIHLEDDALGGSDQIPFTLAGLPCATFVGNSTYYEQNPPQASYPFDQPQDTIQLMNTFASGSSQKAEALTLSLALPGMLTTWMLNQSDILGQAHPDMKTPLAAISDIGQVEANKSIALDGRTAFDPKNPGGTLTYNWNFGDGATASGILANHTYTTIGNYTLSLTVNSAIGTRQITRSITVVSRSTVYDNPYSKYGQPSGVPRVNPSVTLPTPNDGPIVQSHPPGSAQSSTSSSSNMALELLIGLGIVLVIVLVTIFGVGRKKQ